MHYKVRKLLFAKKQARQIPVSYDEFQTELCDFLSHVKDPICFYKKYCDVITNNKHYEKKYILDLFDIPNYKNTNKQFYIVRGFSEQEASQKIQSRQNSNNASTIMSKHKVSFNDALIIQQHRAQKGLQTLISKSSKEQVTENKRLVWANNKHMFFSRLAETLNVDISSAQYIFRRDNALKRDISSCIPNTTILYYLNQGMNLNEANIALKKRQSTFSLEKCKDKYGEEQGIVRWNERQQKWLSTMNAKSDEEKQRILIAKISNGAFVSKESLDFFGKLIIDLPQNLTYLYGNKEYFINHKGKFWKYDFTILELKIIIEYNGIHVHPRDDFDERWIHPFTKETKQQRLAHDKQKHDAAVANGFTVLYVWNDMDLRSQQQHIVNVIAQLYKDYLDVNTHIEIE